MADNQAASSGLFSIFLIAIYTLFLVPYTLYKFCAPSDADQAAQPWQKGKKKGGFSQLAQRATSKGTIVLILLWVGWFLVLLWVQASVREIKPFDPFEILGIEHGATDKEIKKAYRQLSLRFHPDKNPDPAAAQYFAEYISKAYAALTDEASRQNYEKYGHPDGPQAMNIGVALPDWMFAKDKKMAPLMLFCLVFVGILLPLAVASWYMLNSNRYIGANNIMQETLGFYMYSKYNVKESQSLVRIPETLVCAMEFIVLQTPSEHIAPIDELRKMVLRSQPDLKDKPLFWKRKASVLKAHMLLLLHLERETSSIPQLLQPDLKFVLQKCPLLLEEMFKIANLPRPPFGYGWLEPSKAIVEMQQCIAQAMSISIRKPQGKPADPTTLLLQLPRVDMDVAKKLRRRKIQTLKDLADLPDEERREALASCGVPVTGVDEINTLLSVLPSVTMKASCEMEGEDEIMEGDVAKCKVQIILTRPSHRSPNFEPPAKGKAVLAYTPLYPLPHEENWYILLADPANNSVLGFSRVSLAEAEVVGYEHPELVEQWAAAPAADKLELALGPKEGKTAERRAAATASKFIKSYNKNGGRVGSVGAGLDSNGDADGLANGSDTPVGQLIEIPFMAPPRAGRYDLQLIAMCDSYVGSDKVTPVKLRVMPLTRAAQEGRDAKARQQLQDSSDEEDENDGGRSEGGRSKGDNSDDDGSEDGSEYSYDSDETGELESGSDEDEEPTTKSKGAAAADSKPKEVARQPSTDTSSLPLVD